VSPVFFSFVLLISFSFFLCVKKRIHPFLFKLFFSLSRSTHVMQLLRDAVTSCSVILRMVTFTTK
jgi:hypothetical protein